MELFRPDMGLFVWTFAAFIGLVFLLRKYAWTSILSSIEKRNDHIASSLLAAEEAQKKVNNLQEESDLIVAKARNEQIQILQEGRKIRENMILEAKASAQQEAKRIIEEAHRSMIRQREESVKELERRAAALSIDVAEQILRKQLDNPEAQKELAQKLVNDIKLSKV